MIKIGYGVTRHRIPMVVKDLLDRAERDGGYVIPDSRKFVDNRPSKTWVASLFSRHPRLSTRTPENFGFQRTSVTEAVIRDWFVHLKVILKKEHSISASEFLTVENGKRIFNLDESGFPLQGTNGSLKIVAEKGSKNVYRIVPDTKEQVRMVIVMYLYSSFASK